MESIKNNKIGLFDSGLGGLSILKGLVNELPNEDYLFYEDSINNPYGNKSEEELYKIVSDIVKYLINEKCKIIVIACNTATTSCMLKLREEYKDIIFVGTVPAIKKACDLGYKKIINLSTPYTNSSKRVSELIRDNLHSNQELCNVSGQNLAHLIELGETLEIRELLKKLLSDYKNFDALVLGCTHYSLIKDEFKKVLPNTDLIDGVEGISKYVRKVLTDNNLLADRKEKGNITIINTKSDELVERSFEFLKKVEN